MASSATFTTTQLPKFRALLEEWQEKRAPATGFTLPLSELRPTTKDASKDVIVAFRTRPPLPNEAADKFHANLDAEDASTETVEFCAGVTVASAEPGIFVAHVPGMKWNGPTLAHKTYEADLAFGPDVKNEEVYQRTVAVNDLLSLSLSGGVACILAYGQTGSGKTYTMESIEHHIARDLFDVARTVGKRFVQAQGSETALTPEVESGEIFEFNVTFLELLGKHASDLLETTDKFDEQGNPIRTEIAVREDKVGNVRPNLISTGVRTSDDLEELINKALSHRRTTATLRNAKSSRSHALLTITIKNTLLPYAEEGQLILVDLAGSERYEDSKEHDKQRMEEARENNKSLMNLKECVRSKAKMAAEDGFVHIPWRSNKLTMLLKPIFDIESRQPSKAMIIAHVSPHIQDTVHSTNTLSYAAPFLTIPPKPRGPMSYDAEDPRTWDHGKTVQWLTTQFTKLANKSRLAEWKVKAKQAELSGKRLKPLGEDEQIDIGVDVLEICPPGSTAKNLGVLYTPQFVEACLAAQTDQKLTKDQLKMWAVDVIGNLFYLILTAKTRKRTEIMKSRKKLVTDDVYGAAPRELDDDAEIHEAQMVLGPEWYETIDNARKTAKEMGGDTHAALVNTRAGLLAKFRSLKAQQEAKAKEAVDGRDEE
ncbi:Kinesin-like protein [Mycena indigotica]|uniref:Kinesin-like protein n=1 Tax=Mycena indigotica TaxID=2126181 RepID=A0A8H6TEU9_9AGAR|nr:Kinesin-like protein [Mycena indigotica]KAF7315964.1 Kinesin-like protein [Mycena indigotica]